MNAGFVQLTALRTKKILTLPSKFAHKHIDQNGKAVHSISTIKMQQSSFFIYVNSSNMPLL